MSIVYGIFSNSEIKKFDSIENSIKSGALYSCIGNSERIESDSKFHIYKYDFQFYDLSSNNINLSYGNWKLNSKKIAFKLNISLSESLKIKVVDKFGQIDIVEIKGYQVLEIIKDINECLKNMSSYNSWDEYKLKQENDALKSEVKKLKNISDKP
jgi:hypothetical protein